MGAWRMDKVLCDTGRWSRKEAKELIRKGQVLVEGRPVRKPEEKVDPTQVEILVQGEPLIWQEYCYLMLHKPAGVLTATEDQRQKTVLDLIPEPYRKQGVAPVGRLDKDTTGLLLLTNDGALTHRLLSPKYHVAKVYLAEIDGATDESDVAAFAQGITLGDGTVCMPAGLEPLESGRCQVTLYEGKYHQVKRMLAVRGKPVKQLHRATFGPLAMEKGLLEGECRPLTAKEVAALRSATSPDSGGRKQKLSQKAIDNVKKNRYNELDI